MMPLLRSSIGSWPGEVDLNILAKWWEHYPLPVMQNACMKLLWDFTIQTDRHLTHNRPDLTSIDLTRKHVFSIDIAIPED